MQKIMKRGIPVLVLLACTPFAGKAQTPAPGVVTVTFNAAVLQTAEAQQQLNALKTKYAPREAKLQALNDQVTTLQKQLDAMQSLAGLAAARQWRHLLPCATKRSDHCSQPSRAKPPTLSRPAMPSHLPHSTKKN